MGRDKRYGAMLALAAVFLLASVFHSAKQPFRSRHYSAFPAGGPEEFQHAGPLKGPARPPSVPAAPEPRSASVALDLNSATKKELLSLPGIGAVTAERILRKRAELGRFSSVEQLTEVERLGKVKVDTLRGLVTVSNGLPATKNP